MAKRKSRPTRRPTQKRRPAQSSGASSGSFDKGMVEDTDGFHQKPNEWESARNAVNNTVLGDIGELSNESSNYICSSAPYTIIGAIHIGKDEWAIFSTDDTNSEIGIFLEDSCLYEKTVNSQCLNFNRENLIVGVGRTAYNCGRKVYWDDGINPTRVLDIDDVPWIQECIDDNGNEPGGCIICTDTDELDCDKIRLAPVYKDLSFRLEAGSSAGELINGSYYVVGAYLIEGQKVSDYSLPSNIQGLFQHRNVSSSLEIFVEEADVEFDEFELILIQIANFNTVARKIGVYSTRQTKIVIDQLNEGLPTIDSGLVLIRTTIPDKSDGVFRNGQYLIRVGSSDKFDFNYQPLANQITSRWVAVEYDGEYYKNGGNNVGYLRDEVYSYFIRWVYNTGDKSASYHIPGRIGTLPELGPISGDDLTEEEALDPTTTLWKVYNTGSVDSIWTAANSGTVLPDGGIVLGGGNMSYWESSEFYEDKKPEIWNATSNPIWGSTNAAAHDLCGKPIRHHKFPDNASDDSNNPYSLFSTGNMITNHYDPADGNKVRIMSVQFDNIKAPLDNQGIPISNVVGYEILRGSREGNKTVLAKGMLNNLREYIPASAKASDKTYLYPNYPYNPTAPIPSNWDAGADPAQEIIADHFLSGLSDTSGNGTTYGSSGSLFEGSTENFNNYNALLLNDAPLGVVIPSHPITGASYFDGLNGGNFNSNVRKDLVTFHSPETNFRDPFLSLKEIKVYGEMIGTMEGNFRFPKDHPRHKFITNTAFLVSAVLGIGYAMVSTEGKKTTRHKQPTMNFGGTYDQKGTSVGSTGMFGTSAIAAAAQASAVTAAQQSDSVTDDVLSNSMLTLIQNAVGYDSNNARQQALVASGSVSGNTTGAGHEKEWSTEATPWASTPGLLRTIQGVPTFLSFWSEGINKIINLIYAYTPERQYALQQVSHCFYNRFAAPTQTQIRRAVTNANYLSPNLQDFASEYKINNLFRSRSVVLKLEKGLEYPNKHPDSDSGRDDTQALFSDVWDRTNDSIIWSNDANINTTFQRPATSHYVAIKQRVDNQYGQIPNINQIPISTDSTPIKQTTSPILFNGDTYVGRYTEKNTMFFFYDWLKGQPDNTAFNYKFRKYITHPRFWMDTDPFDTGEFVSSLGALFSSTAVPASFDPLMIDPVAVAINTPGTDTYDPNAPIAVCECVELNQGVSYVNSAGVSVISACYLTDFPCGDSGSEDLTDLLEDYCEKTTEAEQLRIYYEFIQECACFKANGADECNENNEAYPTELDVTSLFQSPNLDPPCDASLVGPNFGSYDFPYENQTGNTCATCPTWSGLGQTTSASAALYQDDDDSPKGKWWRKNKRINRKIERAIKKAERKKKRIFKKYLDCLDGDQGGFFEQLGEKIITPNDKFAFDMNKTPSFTFSVKEAFMYLFNSGVRDFFVESEINLAHRDWGEKTEQRHYDDLNYTDLDEIFSTDRIKVGNYMKYDYSLSVSKLFNNFSSWGSVQDRQYDPTIAETCYIYRPKRMLYSLPQDKENKKDFWRVFLPNNYKDFTSVPVNIKPVSNNGALILFETESPIKFLGVDQLKLDLGTKITIGDGELFKQPLQNLTNVDYPHEYGSCQNRLSVINTPAGLFYMSQNQGKIFTYGGKGLQEISNKGKKWWFSQFLPYQLTKHPTAFIDPITGKQKPFDLSDNPVVGIGCQAIFDNDNQIAFFCKKDWVIREDISDIVTYDKGKFFKVNGVLTVELGDPAYFKSASWTASYDVKNQSWIAYHDWHPDLTLPSKKTYMTTKGNGLWVHADRCDSYCNFYGIDYPFEVEYSLHTVGQVNTLRNIMYIMEVYNYADNCYDRFHDLDFNFDEAIIYNSEQCSGLLNLFITPKNNAPELVNYPIINANDIDILYAKEEQKYRFNQFFDITNDRGEFNPASQNTIFITEANGYIKNLNSNNLDYDKFALERKRFRHYKNTVILRRLVSGNKNMIIAMAVQMNLNSPR
jgi:hypothetical protein